MHPCDAAAMVGARGAEDTVAREEGCTKLVGEGGDGGDDGEERSQAAARGRATVSAWVSKRARAKGGRTMQMRLREIGHSTWPTKGRSGR